MDNKKFWESFYKENKVTMKHTNFASYVDLMMFGRKKISILELGCGNGRDTKYFEKRKWVNSITGIDNALDFNMCLFGKRSSMKKVSIEEMFDSFKFYDLIYSRFFLHVISKRNIKKVIKYTPKFFAAEFRIKGDVPVIYKNHKRTKINPSWILKLLEKNNFKVITMKIGTGLSNYKNEDPLVCWVIAEKYVK